MAALVPLSAPFAWAVAAQAPAQAATSLPCDIYAAGGTACAAAHSTTRALFASYNGPLYQVQRASDHSGENPTTTPATPP
ncbi:arabinofuranosidase catalytic domain-containing protein [Microbispora sp. KK1-11]|uniref:arabinofuranosidase catalytic domain-containing protein n=1 Tax=Microbispora sp. KK1-11 TaxID=2053005 RepID=UPI001C8E10B2|nr:arabinofuranosidase catalytic domain-containing protein [Microbispora sp. KK1-11]